MSHLFLPVLILSLVAGCIEVDISVPGFPDMARHFNVVEPIIQLTVAYNFLGFCLAALLYGPLSDKFGRRKVMLLGNGILLLGAVGCVIAPTMNLLLFARFIQGAGASASAVVVSAMIADVYRGHQMIRALSILNSSLTILMAMAPVAGGFINMAIGWWGNYGLVALICALSWIMLMFFLPETKHDPSTKEWRDVWCDYKTMLKCGRFIAYATLPSLLYVGYITFVTSASFLYIETFGLSVIKYAVHQAIIVGSFTMMSFLSARMIKIMGKKRSLLSGIILCCSGVTVLVIISFVNPYSPVLITGCMVVYSWGFAISYPAVFADSLEIFPHAKGTAASIIMSLRNFLCAGFIALAGFFYTGEPLPVFLVLLSCVMITAINCAIVYSHSG